MASVAAPGRIRSGWSKPAWPSTPPASGCGATASRVVGTVVWADEDRRPRWAFCDVDISAGVEVGKLQVLHLDEEGRDLSICTVGLVATCCHLGGLRWWFT